MKKVAEYTVKPTELVRETSYNTRPLGKHPSTMTLYASGPRYFIEWDIPGLELT
jgi:hypothetical protein